MRVDGRTRDADAVRYCDDECYRWTGHEMEENGSYTCRICGET